MTENSIQFLPFNAINEFMRPDFRLIVIRDTLNNLKQLDNKDQEGINRMIKRFVKVPGFRNSDKAPTTIKIIPASKTFETNPEFVAAIIAAWSKIHNELGDFVYQVLKSRGWYFFPDEIKTAINIPDLKSETDWGILPRDADRRVLPGFLIYWPQNQDFEAIYEDFSNLFPEAHYSIDEVSLMTVWLVNRLPYHVGEEKTENTEPEEAS